MSTGEISENVSSEDSISDETSADDDLSENPPPNARGTRFNGPLSPLKPGEQSGDRTLALF